MITIFLTRVSHPFDSLKRAQQPVSTGQSAVQAVFVCLEWNTNYLGQVNNSGRINKSHGKTRVDQMLPWLQSKTKTLYQTVTANNEKTKQLSSTERIASEKKSWLLLKPCWCCASPRWQWCARKRKLHLLLRFNIRLPHTWQKVKEWFVKYRVYSNALECLRFTDFPFSPFVKANSSFSWFCSKHVKQVNALGQDVSQDCLSRLSS